MIYSENIHLLLNAAIDKWNLDTLAEPDFDGVVKLKLSSGDEAKLFLSTKQWQVTEIKLELPRSVRKKFRSLMTQQEYLTGLSEKINWLFYEKYIQPSIDRKIASCKNEPLTCYFERDKSVYFGDNEFVEIELGDSSMGKSLSSKSLDYQQSVQEDDKSYHSLTLSFTSKNPLTASLKLLTPNSPESAYGSLSSTPNDQGKSISKIVTSVTSLLPEGEVSEKRINELILLLPSQALQSFIDEIEEGRNVDLKNIFLTLKNYVRKSVIINRTCILSEVDRLIEMQYSGVLIEHSVASVRNKIKLAKEPQYMRFAVREAQYLIDKLYQKVLKNAHDKSDVKSILKLLWSVNCELLNIDSDEVEIELNLECLLEALVCQLEVNTNLEPVDEYSLWELALVLQKTKIEGAAEKNRFIYEQTSLDKLLKLLPEGDEKYLKKLLVALERGELCILRNENKRKQLSIELIKLFVEYSDNGVIPLPKNQTISWTAFIKPSTSLPKIMDTFFSSVEAELKLQFSIFENDEGVYGCTQDVILWNARNADQLLIIKDMLRYVELNPNYDEWKAKASILLERYFDPNFEK